MLTTDYTRFIAGKLAAQDQAEAAVKAAQDMFARRAVAAGTYSDDELLELAGMAWAEGDERGTRDFTDELSDRPGWVSVIGWKGRFGFDSVMRRPDYLPEQVRWVTRCVCDTANYCSYCSCCEQWNGQHSCDWYEDTRDSGWGEGVVKMAGYWLEGEFFTEVLDQV